MFFWLDSVQRFLQKERIFENNWNNIESARSWALFSETSISIINQVSFFRKNKIKEKKKYHFLVYKCEDNGL